MIALYLPVEEFKINVVQHIVPAVHFFLEAIIYATVKVDILIAEF